MAIRGGLTQQSVMALPLLTAVLVIAGTESAAVKSSALLSGNDTTGRTSSHDDVYIDLGRLHHQQQQGLRTDPSIAVSPSARNEGQHGGGHKGAAAGIGEVGGDVPMPNTFADTERQELDSYYRKLVQPAGSENRVGQQQRYLCKHPDPRRCRPYYYFDGRSAASTSTTRPLVIIVSNGSTPTTLHPETIHRKTLSWHPVDIVRNSAIMDSHDSWFDDEVHLPTDDDPHPEETRRLDEHDVHFTFHTPDPKKQQILHSLVVGEDHHEGLHQRPQQARFPTDRPAKVFRGKDEEQEWPAAGSTSSDNMETIWSEFLREPPTADSAATFAARFVVLTNKKSPAGAIPKMDESRWIRSYSSFEQFDIDHPADEASLTRMIRETGFDPKAPTKIIVHGFLETGDETWIWDVGNALKEAEHCNVIVVDWHEGSSLLYYDVIRNSRTIGRRIATFLEKLEALNPDFSMDRVHLIGHSVGAHACGFVGHFLGPHNKRIGRITGLDPAGFMFSIAPKELRLDASDAKFVDVIHTNAAPVYELGQGIPESCGHVDIYVNGGQKQPGCSVSAFPLEAWAGSLFLGDRSGQDASASDMNSLNEPNRKPERGFQRLLDKLGCHHERAHEYYLETIRSHSCPFTAYECESYHKFLSGECLNCGEEMGTSSEGSRIRRCASTGYGLRVEDLAGTGNRSPASEGKSIIMYTTTNAQAPFCRNHYSLEIQTTHDPAEEPSSSSYGYLHAQIEGRNGSFPYKHLTRHRSKQFQPGRKYSFLVTSDDNIGDVERVKLRWGNDDSYYSSVLCLMENHLNKCKNYIQVEKAAFHGPSPSNSTSLSDYSSRVGLPSQPFLRENQLANATPGSHSKQYCWRKPAQHQTLKNGMWRSFDLEAC